MIKFLFISSTSSNKIQILLTIVKFEMHHLSPLNLSASKIRSLFSFAQLFCKLNYPREISHAHIFGTREKPPANNVGTREKNQKSTFPHFLAT
jgi:hypothetical protein